ncbi:MAG: S8 family serine peptidase [Gemmatimonadota bacterium]
MPAGRRASSSANATSQITPWGVEALRAPQAWTFTQGSGAKLLLIDKGHFQGHEDLPNVPTENCLGGYHDSGCSDYPPQPHGTFMLGVATARDNGFGTLGVAPGIPGTSVFVWGACYEIVVNGVLQHLCDNDRVVEALNWATQNLTPNGVINMSFSHPGTNAAVATAVASAANAGIVMVASAGNFGIEQIEYPAGYSNVIGVSGMRQDSTFATSGSPCEGDNGSNWGAHVDFAAPWDAYTTDWNHQYAGAEQGACGTSEATAYVSGVALLLRAQGWSASDIAYQMALTAKDLGSTDKFGAGLPRADLALGLKATNALAYIQSGKPKLTWNASPLATEYRIYRRVTPTLSPEWTLWAVRTTLTYTDVATGVSSIWGNNSCFIWPSETAVAYHVRAYNATHNVEHVYTSCPTYIANGTPPF